jgi:hypothetical protein
LAQKGVGGRHGIAVWRRRRILVCVGNGIHASVDGNDIACVPAVVGRLADAGDTYALQTINIVGARLLTARATRGGAATELFGEQKDRQKREGQQRGQRVAVRHETPDET